MKQFRIVVFLLSGAFLLAMGKAASAGETPAGVQGDARPLVVAMGPPDMPGGPPVPPWPGALMVPGPFGPPPMPIGGPGLGAWWRDPQIVQQLGLSEPQVRQIAAAFLEHRIRLVDLRADLEQQELGLLPLLVSDTPDDTQVAAQIDRITAARGRLEKAQALMVLALRRVLTPEQWKQLPRLHRESAPNRGPGGPGFGPVGPPPR